MKPLTKFDNYFKQKNFHHGFTLMEVMIVVVTLGVIASLAFSNYTKIMDRSLCHTAQMNLVKIWNAAKIYKIKNGHYYDPPGWTYKADLATILKISIPDDVFDYRMTGEGSVFAIEAIRIKDSTTWCSVNDLAPYPICSSIPNCYNPSAFIWN